MSPKSAVVPLLLIVAAVSSNEWAQAATAPPAGGVVLPPNSLVNCNDPIFSDSEVCNYNYDQTYRGLNSFWSEDIISRFFKHAAEGTLDQVGPMVAQLCDEWKRGNPLLPDAIAIPVGPVELEYTWKQLCR